MICRWNDNSVVSVISNCIGTNPPSSASRYSAVEKKKIHVPHPKAIKYYNKNMGGTDRLDQNVSCYRSNIRSKKWWWPLFLWGIDVSIQNAWLLHRKSCKSTNVPTLDLLDFRRAIAQVLMTKYATPRIRSGVVRSVVSGSLEECQVMLEQITVPWNTSSPNSILPRPIAWTRL
ncbi:hypothetical protein M8J76_004694 [Diaphorina citri]|nr:hypothetical protein M8J76_004694 [Diaphorina citri]